MLRRLAVSLLLKVVGRPIVCCECGRPIFTGFAFILRGRVRVIGAHQHLLRVSFDRTNSIEFAHARLDACPTPQRPWLLEGVEERSP